MTPTREDHLPGVAVLSATMLLVVLPLALGRSEGWPIWTWPAWPPACPRSCCFSP